MPHKLQFRVIHASGQDDNFKASELNSHGPLTKGWVSSRFCLYPQDIVIQLTDRCRIKKIQILSHQYLIATKIEFFVGDIPDGVPFALEQARYQRLGYVSLSDNEKTGFKARELKSVHVDATGQLLRLNIHKNHINKFNLYNQVGVVAINVIGDRMNKPYELPDPSELEAGDNRQNEADSIYNKPDYISPLDDLAFDMYQDPEVAQIIRKLELKKQEAVLQERYDYAKKLKVAVTELQKVGEKLGKMEVEKRQAVENEDYDKAKLKKVQMDEYRLQMYKDLNIHDLLELEGNRHPQPIHFEPARQPTPPRLAQISPPPPQRSPPPKMPYDDRPLPVNKKPPPPEEEEPEPSNEGEPEPLTEKDLREASTAIDVFGEPLVSKAYSKTWSYREDSLLAVYKQLQELPASSPKDEARNMMRAATFLCKRAIDDKVYAVFKAGLSLEKMILTEYIPKHKLSRGDTVYLVDNTLPALLHKAGDTAQRNRDDAKKFVLSMANFPEVKPTHAVPNECTKPIKPTMAPRLAQSRAEITESLYKEHGLNDGLTRDNLMKFSVKTLDHTAGEVREVGERIIKSLYQVEGAKIKDYLPPDTEKTRKNTLYRQLFEYFDQVDGKPSKDDLKKKKADEEAKKQAEIDQLQKQLQQLKDMASGKAPLDEQVISGNKNPKAAPAKKPETKPKVKPKAPPQKAAEEDDVSMLNMDNQCIFCGEHDESFTEEGLDLHYWKSCPMLKRCANCKQVVEISGYTDHLLNECEAKSNFAKCPRCQEAISKVEYDQHVADKACNPAKPNMNHCPLCHTNISNGDDSWNTHLMDRTNGCKNNPRRLLAQNKPGNTGKGGTQNKAKGKAGPTPRAANPGKSTR